VTNGCLTLAGRLKEIVNRGGEKISSREVEEALMDHPAVLQALAFAVRHPMLGEDVGVAGVLRAGFVDTFNTDNTEKSTISLREDESVLHFSCSRIEAALAALATRKEDALCCLSRSSGSAHNLRLETGNFFYLNRP
jgi:acyl-CoA synthetase (AMP-forming)/AMP-acid ligase II